MYRRLARLGVLTVGLLLLSAVPAAASPPVPTSGIVVNEVATHGFITTDEYVEIRRVTTGAQSRLTGWTLRIYDSAGTQTLSFSLSSLTMKAFGTTGQYALIGGTGYLWPLTPDLTLPPGTDIADLGAVAVYNAQGVFVDGVAFSDNSMINGVTGECPPAIGCHAPPLPPDATGSSVSRNEPSTDTDNNAVDFSIQWASPRNNTSAPRN